MTKRMSTRPNFFRANFSAHAEYLSTLTPGVPSAEDASKLASLLCDQDAREPGAWVCDKDSTCATNMANATIFLNGPNHNDLPTNPLFGFVVGIDLGDSTRIYLNYNK